MVHRVLISADAAYDISIGKFAVLVTSLACSAFIMSQCIKHYRDKGGKTSTVVRFLGFKAVSDFVLEVFQIAFTVSAMEDPDEAPPNHLCQFYGFMTQITIVASMSLNFCIALDVFLLLANPFTYDTKVWRNRMLIFVFVLCSGTSFGLLGANKLGDSGNGNCWVTHPTGVASWFLYGPAFFYEGFCIIFVIFFAFKVGRISSVKNSGMDGDEFFRSSLARKMLLKMMAFTAVYIISWSVILTRHIVQLNDPKGFADMPHYVVLTTIASLCVDAFGIWDLFVWYGNLIKCPCLKVRGNDADDDVNYEGVSANMEAKVRASLGNAIEPDRTSLLRQINGDGTANTKASELPPLPEMNSMSYSNTC